MCHGTPEDSLKNYRKIAAEMVPLKDQRRSQHVKLSHLFFCKDSIAPKKGFLKESIGNPTFLGTKAKIALKTVSKKKPMRAAPPIVFLLASFLLV